LVVKAQFWAAGEFFSQIERSSPALPQLIFSTGRFQSSFYELRRDNSTG
jgi:hypothetical protein